MRPICLRGARTNNLAAIDLDVDPGTLVVIAGPSGSGKSSLAFETLYAEGQRRYVESFSAYARQFLERRARPPVTRLEPVPAGIAVDRQQPVKTSRSTVGTMTEVTDYAKELWSQLGVLRCPGCADELHPATPRTVGEELVAGHAGERIAVSYPLSVPDAESYLRIRDGLVAEGYRRLWLDGNTRDLDEVRPSELGLAPETGSEEPGGRIDVVVDRVLVGARDKRRIGEAAEVAFERGHGLMHVHRRDGEALAFSTHLHCGRCDLDFRRPAPGLFSFNSPVGACETCRGFGRTIAIDWDKVVPDGRKSLREGAIRPWATGKSTAWERRLLLRRCQERGVSTTKAFDRLTSAERTFVIEGDGGSWRSGWPGVQGWFRWLERKAYKMQVRVLLARYRKYEVCEACGGSRLKPEALSWRVGGITLADFYNMEIGEAAEWLETLSRPEDGRLVEQLAVRLQTLCDVGLSYLTLDRSVRSLSGGELQRVALTSALSASLNGVMFVLDEPTVGLHPSDVARLLAVVQRLTRGDSVALVVEHDPAVILSADRVVELGPGAGEHGGSVVFDGPPEQLPGASTRTGQSLGRPCALPERRRTPERWLRLRGASGNNLAHIDLDVPLGCFVCVTGVSGSGKSSLILDTLAPALGRQLGDRQRRPLAHEGLRGHEAIRTVIEVDQSPLGRTSRGNPATYMGCWDLVRKRYARAPLSRERGYTAGTFSFNVPGGRCEACKGEGAETVEMQFLADVTFSCPECGGRRFVGPVLDVLIEGRSIADVLELTVQQTLDWLPEDAGMQRALGPLRELGLGYLRLGQPLNTLSAGEAQRLKLAAALGKAQRDGLLILDEPTAGLHATDVEPLLASLDRLVGAGNTVVVVEHDMRVAAHADHVVDMGPGAGAGGGRIVASGTPEEVARADGSRTAQPLGAALGRGRRRGRDKRATRSARTTPSTDAIEVTGVREHNLRDVSLRIPREQLVVVTGPSGSGKSTLAFDVIYAEGQRRYLETLSPYVRQYLPQLPRPAVDRVVGVPPSISLEQRTARAGANSTVATITEIAHHLRLLFARAGVLHCPRCELPVAPRQPATMVRDVRARFDGERIAVLAPVVRGRKGIHRELLARAMSDGMDQARIDGQWRPLRAGMKLDRYKEHDVELVVSRLRADAEQLPRVLARALAMTGGFLAVVGEDAEVALSTKRACPGCGAGYPELDPRLFSFNTRQGQCDRCEGRGVIEHAGRERDAQASLVPCTRCDGTRLAPLARHVRVCGRLITDVTRLSVDAAAPVIDKLRLKGKQDAIAAPLRKEMLSRIAFLQRVGLGYLGLDRAAESLSGGELQRVRLAAQLGSGLTGLLYVLDEPTIGLHPRDTGRLIDALRGLVSKGCSVLVVEHDLDTIESADHLIDVGPGGGREGGRILAQGPPARVANDEASVTGRALRRPAQVPKRRRSKKGARWLELRGARHRNLRGIDLRIPLGRLTAVAGVSGSGKSTLVREVLLRAVRRALKLTTETPGAHDALSGSEHIRRAVEVDQSPIGRTPRSVPATYVGIWDEIRKLYAGTPEARARGYTASRFSFNVRSGRCDSCEGQGATTLEMSFLPQVSLPCEACRGMRFNPETLEVRWQGLHAGDLLDMDIAQVVEVMQPIPKVRRPLELLSGLGLGYLKLGQPSNTLSGGEAQRLKLVAELAASSTGPSLYVMDEPTTGLHRDDVAKLTTVLSRLIERGDTVLVIEHNPDLLLSADWIVDLGPEGGAGGGRIVAEGTPEQVMRSKRSHTGRALERMVVNVPSRVNDALRSGP